MTKAVLDTTVLVSALLNLNPGGVSYELLGFAKQGMFELCISNEILEETAETLRHPRLRQRYTYSEADIVAYCQDLAHIGTIVADVPVVRLVRDPDDDKIIGYAIAAGADYLVTLPGDARQGFAIARRVRGNQHHHARGVPARAARRAIGVRGMRPMRDCRRSEGVVEQACRGAVIRRRRIAAPAAPAGKPAAPGAASATVP